MRKLFFTLTFLALSISSAVGQIKLSDLEDGQLAMITRGYHDSWLIMNNDNEVAFLSPKGGTVNLYSIDLDDVNFIRSNQEGLLIAEYLTDKSYFDRYTPLTTFSDGAIDSPEYSPNGELIAFRRYIKDTTNSKGKKSYELPWKFSVVVINTKTMEMETLITEEVSTMTFLNDSTILYQTEGNDSKFLKTIDIHTKKTKDLIKFSSPAKSITSDDKNFLVHKDGKAFLYDKETLELIDKFKIPESMQRVTYIKDRLTLTPKGGSSSFMDLSSDEITPIVGSFDYEPSVSVDGKFVIVVSENLAGGILYKL